MTRSEIVERLARDRAVEGMCLQITHLPEGSADLQDLSQYIYLVLLEYPEPMLQDLWEHNEMRFLLARLIINNFRSNKSRYHYAIRVFRERSVSLCGLDFMDEG